MTCSGRTAREAAKYSRGLCRAIIAGMRDELRYRGILKDGEVGLHSLEDESKEASLAHGPEQGYSGEFKDDITGQVLKDELVREARRKELR